jgi:MSHA biogenesis protein MshQ
VLALENASCNNIIELPAEECDCNNLGGATCASLGYGSGILRCSGTNTFDFSGCQYTDPHTLLTAYYPLDELSGTNVVDASGHYLNGLLQTPYLSVSWTNSTRGRVLHFEGIPTPTPQERLFLPNRGFQILPTAGQPFTIALWVRPGARAASRYMGIMSCENYGTNGFRLGILPTGQISWWTTQDAGNVELKTPAPVSTNTWHHLAVTYESTRTRLFLDGALAFETTNTGYVPTAGDIRVGDAIDGDPVDPFRGEMDDLRFYSRGLTASEVARLLTQ